jgi:hypothetical protein
MFLGKQHAASDIYSPLFGPAMSFKTNRYNQKLIPDENDLRRFGEKPGLIYTSWLLNQRFGPRKRNGQVHIGRSGSRRVISEALASFPSSSLKGSCRRFRNEAHQHNLWYLSYHYTMERHRETLLWSYLLRMDMNLNGRLDPEERRMMIEDIETGRAQTERGSIRHSIYAEVLAMYIAAGLEPPKVNNDTLWTSLDGPYMIHGVRCDDFNVTECLNLGDREAKLSFSCQTIFKRISFDHGKCGDCMLKFLLEQVPRGLEPLLPPSNQGTIQAHARKLIIKALTKYQYSIVVPNYIFVMINETKSVKEELLAPLFGNGEVKAHYQSFGQICLNDDVETTDATELSSIQAALDTFFHRSYPIKTSYEL